MYKNKLLVKVLFVLFFMPAITAISVSLAMIIWVNDTSTIYKNINLKEVSSFQTFNACNDKSLSDINFIKCIEKVEGQNAWVSSFQFWAIMEGKKEQLGVSNSEFSADLHIDRMATIFELVFTPDSKERLESYRLLSKIAVIYKTSQLAPLIVLIFCFIAVAICMIVDSVASSDKHFPSFSRNSGYYIEGAFRVSILVSSIILAYVLYQVNSLTLMWL